MLVLQVKFWDLTGMEKSNVEVLTHIAYSFDMSDGNNPYTEQLLHITIGTGIGIFCVIASEPFKTI